MNATDRPRANSSMANQPKNSQITSPASDAGKMRLALDEGLVRGIRKWDLVAVTINGIIGREGFHFDDKEVAREALKITAQ